MYLFYLLGCSVQKIPEPDIAITPRLQLKRANTTFASRIQLLTIFSRDKLAISPYKYRHLPLSIHPPALVSSSLFSPQNLKGIVFVFSILPQGLLLTCMAVSLISHVVSDLCIGKPPLRSLPITATVGEALVALKLCGETFVSVAAASTAASKNKNKAAEIAGKICMVDVLCYLCAEGNISAPVSALKDPVSVLLSKGEGIVRRVNANSRYFVVSWI